MIRREFMRRMAHAALAGMFGVELLSRAPRLLTPDPLIDSVATGTALPYINFFEVGQSMGVGTITAINYAKRTVTVDSIVKADCLWWTESLHWLTEIPE